MFNIPKLKLVRKCIGLATKWLRSLPLDGIDKIRDHLVASPIETDRTLKFESWIRNFVYFSNNNVNLTLKFIMIVWIFNEEWLSYSTIYVEILLGFPESRYVTKFKKSLKAIYTFKELAFYWMMYVPFLSWHFTIHRELREFSFKTLLW